MSEEIAVKNSNYHSPSSANLKNRYIELAAEGSKLFPKVDQKLLLDMIKFECTYDDWEGHLMLKIVYPSQVSDLMNKKDLLYEMYQRVASIEERTLRLKVVRFYLQNLEELLARDSDIEYITGSASLSPTDAYAT